MYMYIQHISCSSGYFTFTNPVWSLKSTLDLDVRSGVVWIGVNLGPAFDRGLIGSVLVPWPC